MRRVKYWRKYGVGINFFPWLQTFITRKFKLHLRRVSAVDNFPTRWCTSTLGFTCSSAFGCKISHQVDWERWSDTLATTITGYHPLDVLLWGFVKDKVFSTSVPDITNLKARITDAFATITEHMLENKICIYICIPRAVVFL